VSFFKALKAYFLAGNFIVEIHHLELYETAKLPGGKYPRGILGGKMS